MRPINMRLAAAGATPWAPINRLQTSYQVALGVMLSSGAVLTYSVQYTMDDFQDPLNTTQEFTASRTTTVLTITKVNHGLSVGDYVKTWNLGAGLDTEGSVASVVDANNFTVTVANSGATSQVPQVGSLQTARLFNHSTMKALTASSSGDFSSPPVACRMIITAYTSGFADFTAIQGRG